MTYKRNVPEKVIKRWKDLNPDYNVELSLDADCIDFLRKHFNEYIANLFLSIPEGMYKADLWRLCKLYVHGGVYADVDLVPYISLDTLLDNLKSSSFMTCMSYFEKSIFQAFMIVKKPRSPLLLSMIISFLQNKPYLIFNGPTFDMYTCIQKNIQRRNESLRPETLHKIPKVSIQIDFGKSSQSIKTVPLHWFPKHVKYFIRLIHQNDIPDLFHFHIANNDLVIRRSDKNEGWTYDHSCEIIIFCDETTFLFPEKCRNEINKKLEDFYVSYRGKKILDSRDKEYLDNNKEWF